MAISGLPRARTMRFRLRCLLEELIDAAKQGVLRGFDRFANGSVQLSSVV
jgi:hypothetical protein